MKTIARTTNVLIMHMLHNRRRQQMNQIIKATVQCVYHSLKSQPSVCHATDQQICRGCVHSDGQDSPRRCALCPSDRPSWKLECYTRPATEPPLPYTVVNRVQVGAVGEVRHRTLQELSSSTSGILYICLVSTLSKG